MSFPTPHIQSPRSAHSHTAILLHGRGSDGPEFAEEFLSCKTSQGKTLPGSLPDWRWVLPTSRLRWSTVFVEEMCAWFDATSLDDIQKRQDLQADGLRESVSHILKILEEEINLLDGRSDRVYLGGISQGMATSLWTLLCAPGRIHAPLGGFVGFCGWLPFAHQAEQVINQNGHAQRKRIVSDLFRRIITDPEDLPQRDSDDLSVLKTPVFLSHGVDDPWVSVNLGRQAAQVLQGMGIQTEWNEFTGAESDGHWIKEPEGFDQVLRFFEKQELQ
jgi:lysophospholipase-2